jgi:predicted dehydrogenase
MRREIQVAKVKTAVVGAGAQGFGTHVRACMETDDIELIAVCDIQQTKLERVTAKYNVPYTFTDYRQLLNMEEVKAVIIALPNYLHAQVTIDALRAGKHVLVEKPMAFNSEEARAMLAARDQTGKVLMVGQNNRFRPEAILMKEMVSSGACGEVYNAEAAWWRRLCGQRGWFIDKNRAGGGALVDIGVHALDLCWWLMGCPTPEHVLGMSYQKFGDVIRNTPTIFGDYEPDTPFTVDDFAAGLIKFTDGRTLYIGASWAANTEDRGIVVVLRGTKAGFSMDSSGLRFITERDGKLVIEKPTLPPGRSLHQHFANCIRGKEEVIPKPEHGLQVMKMLDAIYESTKKGGAVQLTPENAG